LGEANCQYKGDEIIHPRGMVVNLNLQEDVFNYLTCPECKGKSSIPQSICVMNCNYQIKGKDQRNLIYKDFGNESKNSEVITEQDWKQLHIATQPLNT